MENCIRVLNVVLFASIFLIFLCTGCSDDSPTSESEPVIMRAAIYNDQGAWAEGTNRIYSLLTSWGWTAEYITANEINTGYLNSGFNLIIFPGGYAGGFNAAINTTGEAELRGFVSAGGGYVGICAGAFWAMDRIIWNGNEIDYPLNLLPGTATGPLEDLCSSGETCWVDVEFSENHPGSGGVSGSVSAYYYDGPEFNSPSSDVFGYYSDIESPAAISGAYGSGRVAVIGVHPEMSYATKSILQGMVEWASESSHSASRTSRTLRPSFSRVKGLDIKLTPSSRIP